MKKFAFALVLLALFSVSFFSQTKKKQPVKKVGAVRVKLPPQPKNPPKEIKPEPQTLGITYEKFVSNHEINADGTAVETWEIRQRFETDLVIERFKKFEREFNGDLQKAEVLEAYILKADGKKAEVPAEAIQIKPTAQAEAAPAFSSQKEVSVNFKDLKAGDASCIKVRLTTLKPQFDKKFNMLAVFPYTFGWKSIEINVSAPTDFPLFVQAVDLAGGRLADENGRARWQWRRENLPAFEIEAGMTDFFNDSPRLAISSFGNFDELGAAYWSEMRKKAVVTPEAQALADEITKDIKDPQQQAYAIYEWVNKNIRYLSIVLDKGGWIPHSTTEILTNRYGDCKDYATIIHVLLKAKGIESHPVLIRSEYGNWFPEVAVADYFNHAILYIPSLKLFADATAPNTRLGLIPQSVVGKKAVLSGEKTGVIEMPKDNPDDNQLLSEVELTFNADGSVKALSKNIYDGRTEVLFRPLFADSFLQRNSVDFVRVLLAYFGVEGSGRLVKVGNPFKVGEPFSVEFEVNLPNFTTFMPKGSLRLPVAINMMNSLEIEQFVRSEQRKTNLVLGATRFRENFRINFPAGVKIEELPPAIVFSNAVGSYRNEFVLENGAVRMIRELVINKDVIPAKDYALARDLVAKSVEAFNAEIKYSADPNLSRQKSRELRKSPAPVKDPKALARMMLEGIEEKPLTAAQVAQSEAKLLKNPNDLETRKRLLRHYASDEIRETPARLKSRLKHRLWLLQNHPELGDYEIYSFPAPYLSSEDAEYQTIKTEWLKQVEANKTNSRVRLNAVDFVRFEEPALAEKLLVEGRQLDKENYEFPLALSQTFYRKTETPFYDEPAEEKAERLKNKTPNLEKSYEAGEAALALLKKERSGERDEKRAGLLQTLANAAFELGKHDRAKQLATELILDFGQNAEDGNYNDAAHTGNIVLGRVALQQNDLGKAKEHLLIAVRAPLRREKEYFSSVDTNLARELFEKGEKDTVVEYLKLSEKLFETSELNKDETSAVKLWLEQIKQGKTPSFDFNKP